MTITDAELMTLLGFKSTNEQLIIRALAVEQGLTIPQMFRVAMCYYHREKKPGTNPSHPLYVPYGCPALD